MELTLYSREGCHLCEEMHDALRACQELYGFSLKVVDVDTDQALHEKYNEKVPVLAAPEGEICHYHLDKNAVSRYFASKPS